MQLTEEKITPQDKEVAVTRLRSVITTEESLAHRTFHLIRYFFNSLHYLDCLYNDERCKTGVEIPFNGMYIFHSSQYRKRVEEDISNATKEDFETTVVDWSEDAESAMGGIMLLKYGEKYLQAILEYEKYLPLSKKNDERSKVAWVKAKIKLEKMFLRDYLSEVDIAKFDEKRMNERINSFTQDGRYPADFYQTTVAAIYAD